MKTIVMYETDDGKRFVNEHQAIEHENKENEKMNKNFSKVQKCSGVSNTLIKYGLQHKAVWEIRAEDTNPNFSGSHYQALIGIYECTLEQAIEVAAKSPNFFAWGSGGSITKVDIQKL